MSSPWSRRVHESTDRHAQTERLVPAASNPFITMIGHMTGRQLLRRPGYDLDIDRVLAACAEHGVAVEVNGNPWRLDLDWRWLRRGIELGCKFSINPDAHSTSEIASSTRWGLAIARKSGMPADRVIPRPGLIGTLATGAQRAGSAATGAPP
jgi:DNA polymerase (family 10)